MNLDLNQVISAALAQAVAEGMGQAVETATQPIVVDLVDLTGRHESLRGHVLQLRQDVAQVGNLLDELRTLRHELEGLKNQASHVDRDLTEAQNQINCLREELGALKKQPATGFSFKSEPFVEAVESLFDLRIDMALDRFATSTEFSDAAQAVADERIVRKMSNWTDLPEFEEGVKEFITEMFEDEIEVKSLIEPAVDLIFEDLDFEDKIREALVNSVTLRVTVE